jgi:hypothetical protein
LALGAHQDVLGLKQGAAGPAYALFSGPVFNKAAGWPNGKALDYESRDCRFDPCVGQFFGFFFPVYHDRNIYFCTNF